MKGLNEALTSALAPLLPPSTGHKILKTIASAVQVGRLFFQQQNDGTSLSIGC